VSRQRHRCPGKLRGPCWDSTTAGGGRLAGRRPGPQARRHRLADRNPGDTNVQGHLAQSLRSLGITQRQLHRPAEAVASFRRAIHIGERLTSPNYVENLACYQALLADVAANGRAAADQAMSSLRRAIAAGFQNLHSLGTDTDLDALRSRPDFQKLVKDLEAKAVRK
jgi:hypothetical protein